jgi:predicted AAA+ superfamily ATPase
VLDEVHKYASWSSEIKNLYGRYPNLQIVFTGSSVINSSRQEADLNRRALMCELKGMLYREYLQLAHGMELAPLTLEELTMANRDIRSGFPAGFKPFALFGEYLRCGYYPFAWKI